MDFHVTVPLNSSKSRRPCAAGIYERGRHNASSAVSIFRPPRKPLSRGARGVETAERTLPLGWACCYTRRLDANTVQQNHDVLLSNQSLAFSGPSPHLHRCAGSSDLELITSAYRRCQSVTFPAVVDQQTIRGLPCDLRRLGMPAQTGLAVRVAATIKPRCLFRRPS